MVLLDATMTAPPTRIYAPFSGASSFAASSSSISMFLASPNGISMLSTSSSGISRPVRVRRCREVKCEAGSNQEDAPASGSKEDKPSFGYTRKDVLLIGLGITVFGFALKSGLELAGLDSLKAGNIVQLVMVLGLCLGWVYSYIFRVSNKDMTYIKQLKDYEAKVMEKRYQEMPEAELETLLAQVEEEKERIRQRRANRNTTSS